MKKKEGDLRLEEAFLPAQPELVWVYLDGQEATGFEGDEGTVEQHHFWTRSACTTMRQDSNHSWVRVILPSQVMKYSATQSLLHCSERLHLFSCSALPSRSMQSSWAPNMEYHGAPFCNVLTRK